jgi:hypothetical protein
VAIRADDLALLDLGQDSLPAAAAQALRDVEALVAQVIELQYEWIALAAVDARMVT